MTGSNVIWTAKEAAEATGGKAAGEWSAEGVSIDTRSLLPGDLFIAIKGDVTDGHKYVVKAIEGGAVAAVVSEKIDGVPEDKLLIVADTFKAMEDLGIASRARTGAKVIGVTGSVGKTSTKEFLAAAFKSLGQTHASVKSFNNHWGVPYSLSTMHAGSDYAIFEMGMNHTGEISPLSQFVRPDISIITTVQPVHVGNFENGIEGIASAKAEIFDGMKEGSHAILNADNEWFDYLASFAKSKGIHVHGFGEGDNADAKLIECIEASNGSRVTANILGEEISYNLQIIGMHHVMNSLAVLAAVKLADGDVQKAAKALGKLEALAGRGKQEKINIGDPNNPVTLIDESYNASPASMRAAFKVLALIDPGRGGRRIAVLGDMYELGQDSAKLHKELALPLEAAGVQLVYTSGSLMKNLYDNIPQDKRGAHADDTRELAQIVPEVLVPGDVVMVKGSRGGGDKPRMQLVVEALRAMPERMNVAGKAQQ
jgi:UDP-N-acetylmuramoyl-tripeptide--D-alanyl-D-alanine ligase